MSGDNRPLLVGLSDPKERAPEFALVPWPRGAVGANLYRLVQAAAYRARRLAYTDLDYLRDFRRFNLVPWPLVGSEVLQRRAAHHILHEYRSGTVVALGRDVGAAFGLDALAGPAVCRRLHERSVAWVPTPTANNRYYQDDDACRLIGDFLYGLVRRY